MDEIRGVCKELEKRPTKTEGKCYYTFKVEDVMYSAFSIIPEGLMNGDKIEFNSKKSGQYNNVDGEIRIIEKNPNQSTLGTKETEEGEKKLDMKRASEITDVDTIVSEAANILSKCKKACEQVMEKVDNDIVNTLFIHVTRELRK